jgi:hypothetical protein
MIFPKNPLLSCTIIQEWTTAEETQELTDWSRIGTSDCRTFATLNLMFGTLIIEKCVSEALKVKSFFDFLVVTHLSFDELITTGSSF